MPRHTAEHINPTLVPTDGLYTQQQHFDFLGDIETIWDEYSGLGVTAGVYDDGVQYTHHDLDDNYDAGLHVTVGGSVLDPFPTGSADNHGTAVAGLIGAEANGDGAIGVAFGATLSGVNIFSGPANVNSFNPTGFYEAMMQMDSFDITNHSWGGDPSFQNSGSFTANSIAGFEDAVLNGRGGLGTISLKAAGNDGDNAQGDDLNGTRFNIAVGAHADDNEVSWYSNRGANLLISSPSNGGAGNAGVTTTDRLGSDGYGNSDYTSTFGGTSAATPIAAGVVALMLEANPDLGWRDVQTILGYSAHHLGSDFGAGPAGDEFFTWEFNGADNWNGGGLHYSEDYGLGGIDAFNAVRMAEIWTVFADAQTSVNEQAASGPDQNNLGLAIPDAGGGALTHTYSVGGLGDFDIEYVEIDIEITHTWLPDLAIDLISPDGTEISLISEETDDFITSNLATFGWGWTFGAHSFKGETPDGDWTLVITDEAGADVGTLDGLELTFYGRADGVAGYEADDDVYHYTDEVFWALGHQAGRLDLTDSDGDDWLNMAAMTGDLDLELRSGGGVSADGTDFAAFTAGTVIENAVGGDGDDTLGGRTGVNHLIGMRGDDKLQGRGGDDLLEGGAGRDKLKGNSGDDTLIGGDGDDRLVGGGRADIFVYADDDEGSDRIIGWDDGDDRIDLTALGLGFGDLAVSDVGGDTLITFGSTEITLASVQSTDIDATDFVF